MLAFTRATVFVTPDESLRDATVVVDAGRIAAIGPAIPIPPQSKVVDCSGLTITAGFWNSHVHFFERKWAEARSIPADELQRQLTQTFARHGFTSVFDLGSSYENTSAIRERIERGEVAGPRIRTTGPGIVAPGMLPSDDVHRVMGVMRFAAPEVTTGAEATAAVDRLIDSGVDGIKLFPIAEPALAAAVETSHRRGKLVFLHPNRGEDVVAAVRAGVDVIAHTTPRSPAAIDSRVALTPTLHIWSWFMRHDRISTQEKAAETCVDQLRKFVDVRGTVLFGTDLGAVDPDPAPEFALMRRAGMTFAQILESLTTAPAARFGVSDRLGKIAPGYDADLTVFGTDITDIRFTVARGSIVPV